MASCPNSAQDFLTALSSFRRYSSSGPESESPAAWLDASAAQIQQIAQEAFDPTDLEAYKAWFGCNWRLLLLTRQLCPDSATSLAEITCKIGDVLTSLQNYKAMIDRLIHLHANSTSPIELENVKALDTDAICAQLFIMCKDKGQYDRLANLQNNDAEQILDLIQLLLDLPSLDRIFRPVFMSALLRLSRKSQCYPSDLIQKEVNLEPCARASGAFGDIWKGIFKEKPVAVKVLRLSPNTHSSNHRTRNYLKEPLIWRQLKHVNVLPFLCMYHVDNDPRRISFVSPWIDGGNLEEYLHRVNHANRVQILLGVANGLHYLHSMEPTVIHGDLKAVNVAITEDGEACLVDFGLSSISALDILPATESVSAGLANVRWSAPEYLREPQPIATKESDIYAFACVVYEAFAGHMPFPLIAQGVVFQVAVLVMGGSRPPRPTRYEPEGIECCDLGLDDEVWSLVEQCWLDEPERRPTVADLVSRLTLKLEAEAEDGTAN